MRKLVATLACRNNGSRLYGKPLQNLDVKGGVTILEHMVRTLETVPVISDIILGISEGPDNLAFVEYARTRGLTFLVGDPVDVLRRLIQCLDATGGTDAFRMTTESPFIYYDRIEEAWNLHLKNGNDVTSTDGLPEGCHFEIFTKKTLETSHALGTSEHRSEMCSRYVMQHFQDFKVEILPLPRKLHRCNDLRLTVDYPEDLVVCREAYMALRHYAPRIPIDMIIDHLDANPRLKALVAPYVAPKSIWPVETPLV